LFGSFARGDYFPGSDVDVLIILNESTKPFLSRIAEFLPRSFPVDIDVFPYALEEFGTTTVNRGEQLGGLKKSGSFEHPAGCVLPASARSHPEEAHDEPARPILPQPAVPC
jgi:hypothetical protein